MKTFNVGLIGMGTVGTGVAKILLEKDSPLLEKLDCIPVLKGIADCNPDVKNKLNLSPDIFFTNDAKALFKQSRHPGRCRAYRRNKSGKGNHHDSP